MTKVRAPISFAQAVTKVAGEIGWDAAASLVNRSERTIRLWSEPDQETAPTIGQALALDTAFIAAGGEFAPIGEAYMSLLGIRTAAARACRDELTAAVADASRETGDAIAHAIRIIQPGHDEAAIHRAIIEVSDGETALRRLGARLKSFLNVGAGPAGGKPGGAQ